MLVNKDTPAILSWLELMIGPTFRKEKVEFVKMLLNLYYKEIVDNV
jgi:hypothetical protein